MSHFQERSPEIQGLLVKAAEGTLDDDERRTFDRLMEEDLSLAVELREFKAVGKSLGQFRVRNPNPGDWESFERSLAGRGARFTGWLALLAGYLLLAATGLWQLFASSQLPLPFKIGTGALTIGFGVLFAYVWRGFIKERREDPYKDIVR